jgi:hypothetical protein
MIASVALMLGADPMRTLAAIPILVLAMAAPAAHAQEKAAATPGAPTGVARDLSSEESTALAEANRKKAEVLQRARDLKLERATRSICTGC